MGNGNSSAITINLDRNNLLYFSDETVSGTIDLNIRQGKLKADEIYIILMGEIGNTTMPVFSHSNSGFLARSSVKPKYHHIPFYSAKVIIVPPVRQKKLIFGQGQYSWPFDIPLTDYLPPTFDEPQSFPHVRYYLQVVIDKP
ncbi:unnamed protein product [Rotaria sp. Silwood1]|nr:unnamed protein product [Rotaria sp. Silwood1]CAF3571320.1 unnamed protein product [Rotaria sp. Silwood1]CAF4733313.1 unnamed protein product [Rotaria sp. Silwood1]